MERDVSSVVERLLVVRWVVGSTPRSGPIEIFLLPASAPRLVKQRPWYGVLSCLWDGACKRSIAANGKRVAHVAAAVIYHMSDAI